MKKVTIYTSWGDEVSCFVPELDKLNIALQAESVRYIPVELNEDARRYAFIRSKDIRMIIVEPVEPDEEHAPEEEKPS